VYSRWRDDDLPAAPEAAAKLWALVEASWSDEELHQRFLTACLEARDLSYAARCYRRHDDPMAQRQLEKLTTLGVQAMRGEERPSRVDPRIFRITGWVLFFLISIALLVLAFLARTS
jgi:hypothetical protein